MFGPKYIASSNAYEIIEKNLSKINWSYVWSYLSANPMVSFEFKRQLDYEKMRNACEPFAEELAKYVFNPLRIQKMAESYDVDMFEYLELI